MKTKEIHIKVYEYATVSELPEMDQKLVLKAREASKNAYSPYSHFNVGAAVLLENGKIVLGSNQENAAYPSGLCAERVAMFYANSSYPNSAIKTIAVSASNAFGLIEHPTSPCGACRQSLAEAEIRFKKPIRIILDGREKIQVLQGIESLLPIAFSPDSLL